MAKISHDHCPLACKISLLDILLELDLPTKDPEILWHKQQLLCVGGGGQGHISPLFSSTEFRKHEIYTVTRI